MRRSAIHGASQFTMTELSIHARKGNSLQIICDYLLASSTATATATVIPTMGLLPAPDNRRRASLQACLQASRGRLLHERCV